MFDLAETLYRSGPAAISSQARPPARPIMRHSMNASIYRLKYRDILTLCVMALLCLGVLMVQSASMRLPARPEGQAIGATPMRWQWTTAGVQQVKFAVAALCAYFL